MTKVNSPVHSNINDYSALLKSLDVKSLLSTCTSAIQKSFYEQSIFFAANNQAIAEKYHQYKDLSWTQKFKIGVIKGGQNIFVSYLIVKSLKVLLSEIPSGIAATTQRPSMLDFLAAAVVEEILFRGVLQNCLAGSQKIAAYVTPNCLQNNRVFKWLTSPSARIISINAMFAGSHFYNSGGYLSDKATLRQVSLIMLQPIEGILHETTGSIIAPIAFHVTNNLLVLSLNKVFS